MQGRGASVHYVPLLESAAGPTPVELQEALPLAALLAPAAACKDALSALLDALQPEAHLPGRRGFGGALQATTVSLTLCSTIPGMEAEQPPVLCPAAPPLQQWWTA